ncbi:MAG: hypothetical protein RSC72_15425 [Algoriella sp.]|uniref:hypothetical protein n=1 Tax=Algoriella sp. TaxID=1872434 RepID=UPI002FC6DF42
MSATNSERLITEINSNIFFKEFTFSKNDFKELDNKQKLEFADNVVWLDNLFFIYQIKEKEANSSEQTKWFENKVLNKAVKQIKSTIKYISTYPEIYIENEKGHRLNILQAKENLKIRKIIIYNPDVDFPDQKRTQKFYESTDVGLIHLFHTEDYYWICKFLITPAEIDEYLSFRERLFLFNKEVSNSLPEQYFLGHFFETLETDHFNASYINNVKNFKENEEDFDISQIIKNFNKNIKLINYQTEYYPIIQELAKLNRSELIEFKKRLVLSIQKCEEEDYIIPYRIYIPATDCGFVFIPLHSTKAHNWKIALHNLTMAHKYESKSQKCVGVIIFRDQKQKEYYEFFWGFLDFDWQYDETLDKELRENFPFRKSKVQQVQNRYKKL